ncbi:MAG: hypothetical protein R3C01_13525 [Planctomycetaceae bacterium]
MPHLLPYGRFSRSLLLMAVALLGMGQNGWGQWGHVAGKVLLDGEIPVLPPKVEPGSSSAKLCGQNEIPDYTFKVDPKTHGISDVFILIRQRPAKIHPDLEPIPRRPQKSPPKPTEKEPTQAALAERTLAETEKSDEPQGLVVNVKGCQFFPYTMIVRIGQPVRITSSDVVLHHIRPFYILNYGWGAMLAGPEDYSDVPQSSLKKPEPLPTLVTCDVYSHMESWWYVSDHPYHAITDAQGGFRIDNLPVGEHTLTIWHSRTGYIIKSLTVKIQNDTTTTLEPIKVPVARFDKKPKS